MRRGRSLDFDECMRTEFRIVSRIVRGHDFYEGMRAVIVDKDKAPRWRPAALEAVSDAEVERHFAPLGRRARSCHERSAQQQPQTLEPVHAGEAETPRASDGPRGWSCSCA